MSQSYYITVKKRDLFLKDGDHHGRGGGVADPHGQEGGRQHEPQHQKSTRDQPQNNIYFSYNQLTIEHWLKIIMSSKLLVSFKAHNAVYATF
jgi:hypothetical protein